MTEAVAPPKPVCFEGDNPDAVKTECRALVEQGGYLITWQFVLRKNKWVKLPINGWAHNDRTSADPEKVDIVAGIYPAWLPGASNIVALDVDSDVDACKEWLDSFDPEKPRFRPIRIMSAGGRGFHYIYQKPAGGRFSKINQWGVSPPDANGEVIRDWKRWGAIGSLASLRSINEAVGLANEDALAKPPRGICIRPARGRTAAVVNPRLPAGDYSDFAVLGDGHCYVCGEGETRFIASHSFKGGEPGPWCWSCQPGFGEYTEWLTDLRAKASLAGKMPAASKQVPEGESQDDALRVADIMLDEHGDDVRYAPERPAGDDWLLFRDGIWRTRWGPTDARYPESALAQKARNLLEELGIDKGASNKVTRTLAWLKTKLARDYQWDKTDGVIPLPDGTVWTKDGPREGRREDFITRTLPYAPSDTWRNTRWESFVEESVGVDAADYVRRLFGYALLGDPRQHKFALLVGSGGNGKTLFLETVRKAAGPLAEATSMEYFLASKNDAHPQYMARLDGARIVIAEEAPERASWRSDLLKRFTGGGLIEARYMRRGSFTFKPKGTLFLAMNTLPQLQSVDDAIRRRILAVPFPNTPRNPDIDLGEKLEAELPAVVRWLLDGAEEYLATKSLLPPDRIKGFTDAYLEAQDTPLRFLAGCPKGEHYSVTRAALKGAYKDWCEGQGLRPVSPQAWTDRVRRLDGVKELTKKWKGIGLPLDDTENTGHEDEGKDAFSKPEWAKGLI